MSICENLEHSQVDWLAYMVSKKNMSEDEHEGKHMMVEWDAASNDEVETLEQLLGETKDILNRYIRFSYSSMPMKK